MIADHGNVEFGYWHIEPTVRSGERVTAYRTVIGKVARSWEHVHFAEHRNGVYVNPLRPGAMGPYTDTTVPTVRAVTVQRSPPGRSPLPRAARRRTGASIWSPRPTTRRRSRSRAPGTTSR